MQTFVILFSQGDINSATDKPFMMLSANALTIETIISLVLMNNIFSSYKFLMNITIYSILAVGLYQRSYGFE